MTANLLLTILKLALTCVLIVPGIVSAQSSAPLSAKKPNILILWGDDIGYWNVSAYNQGMMGYKTPNIDRIAKEGAYLVPVVPGWCQKLGTPLDERFV